MRYSYLALKRILQAFVAFIIVTVAIFIFWRSFPDLILVESFINPHSMVPRQVQIQMAEGYLHINYPIYLQYFGFLINIFTGKWGYFSTYLGTFSGVHSGIQVFLFASWSVLNSIFIMMLSLLVAFIIFRSLGRSYTLKLGKPFNWLTTLTLFVILFTFVPLSIYFISFGINTVFPSAAIPLYGVGYPSSLSGSLYSRYFYLPYAFTVPTHVPLLDALINGDGYRTLIFLCHIILPVLSISIALASVLLIIRRNTIRKIAVKLKKDSEEKDTSVTGYETKRHIRNELRIGIFSNSLVFATVLIAATAYSEMLFGYFDGLGYSIPWIFSTQNIGTHIWILVYTMLLYLAIMIVISLIFSLLKIYFDRKSSFQMKYERIQKKENEVHSVK